jgi:hypothetical protein
MILSNKTKLVLISIAIIGLIITFTFFLYSRNQEKQVQADLFKKKQECASYREDIEKRLETRFRLDQIFYSPSRNSCLYSYQNDQVRFHFIADYLTNGNVFSSAEIIEETERERSWQKKIKELKD